MPIKFYILYFLALCYMVSFGATIGLSIYLATGRVVVGDAAERRQEHDAQHEEPILGAFGPISTVMILFFVPLLILITTAGYAIYLKMSDPMGFNRYVLRKKTLPDQNMDPLSAMNSDMYQSRPARMPDLDLGV